MRKCASRDGGPMAGQQMSKRVDEPMRESAM